MVVWKGWGILALIIPIICGLLMELGLDSYYGADFYKTTTWPIPAAILISSVMVFLVGTKLNSKPGRIVVDPETNEQFEMKTTHSLFWIPMQYWGIILVMISLLMYFAH